MEEDAGIAENCIHSLNSRTIKYMAQSAKSVIINSVKN
jgi:hypothetical protein